MKRWISWVLFLATLRGLHSIATKGMPRPSDLAIIAAVAIGAALVLMLSHHVSQQSPPDLHTPQKETNQ